MQSGEFGLQVRLPQLTPRSGYGLPVLICVQLEHVIPPVGVVNVERIPTLPAFATLVCVWVTVTDGSVIGCDTDQRFCIVFWDVSQPFQVTATSVATVKFMVRVSVAAL